MMKDILNNSYTRYGSIALVVFLVVGGIFLVEMHSSPKPEGDEVTEKICPTRSSFTAVWEAWTNQFLAENPGAGSEAQLQEWKSLMVGIGCPEWADPFRNVIATSTYTNANGSTSVIYQYELPE